MEIKTVQPLHDIEEKIYMSKIKEAFENGTAFIPFITCGDPTLDVTKEAIIEMEKAGADIIELGIPFSDPTAEGPVVQEANIRALKNKITTNHIFQMVEEVREQVKIPFVFVTYANVVYSYGTEKFMKKCEEIGVDGVVLPDIPFEEKTEFEEICKKYNIDFISTIAPTSEGRIGKIAREATGFLYCASALEMPKESSPKNLADMVTKVKEEQNIPCAVHYEHITAEQIGQIASGVEGIIVGSSIVKLCEKHGENAPAHIGSYVKEMKEAVLQA